MNPTRLTRERLAAILQCSRLEDASFAELLDWFQTEPGVSSHLPDGICAADPRTSERVVFNAARAKRPHDNRPGKGALPECIVCAGKLTKVIDTADLSDGFTFLNKNLYPVVFPHIADGSPEDPAAEHWPPSGVASYGLHLLQWTSSVHELDWHNMPSADRLIAMRRLAALERKLLLESEGRFPAAEKWGGPAGIHGFVQVIKNSGAPVGGSIAHGHQQIVMTNVMPKRARDDWRFEKSRGEKFSEYILRENPRELFLADYGAVVLLVPHYMRRPFDMLLVLKDSRPRYLHELEEATLGALAEGWRDGIRLMRWALSSLGRAIAYNAVLHTGPGAGIYTEFLPYTQEVGGLEQSGLWICQANPMEAAEQLRRTLDSGSDRSREGGRAGA